MHRAGLKVSGKAGPSNEYQNYDRHLNNELESIVDSYGSAKGESRQNRNLS